MAGDWPRTPTERRDARRQIAEDIALARMTVAGARDKNERGWDVIAPDGTPVVRRWARGEFWIVKRMVEQIVGHEWAE